MSDDLFDDDPADTDLLGRRLREALEHRAAAVDPADRLEAIRARVAVATASAAADKAGRRWRAPVLAAASAGILALGSFAALRLGDGPSNPATHQVPAVTSSTGSIGPTPPASSVRPPTSAPSGTVSAPATGVPAPNPTGTPPGTVVPTPPQVAGVRPLNLPVYLIGGVGGTTAGFGLYREYVSVPVSDPATDEDRVGAALQAAMSPDVVTRWPGYLQTWAGISVETVSVGKRQIAVGLSGAGITDPGSDPGGDIARLAVQQLVWTAQAALGRGALPVRFLTPGGAALFGRYPISTAYTRPPADHAFRDLAPLWITSPARDQRIPLATATTKGVQASGQACVFEGALHYELNRDGVYVEDSAVHADSGCPVRGAWRVDLGRLPAGSYVLRAFALSPRDGSVSAQTMMPFTVR